MTEKILPIPCTNVEEKTVKDWFQKINEELDELKDATVYNLYLSNGIDCAKHICAPEQRYKIAEEAADTITAIISMLEAMGIDEDMRQEAQRRVNEKNKERGRV
jgi:NTP pyrophosphatase (non-canonical NTP hydrolase)